MGYRESYEAWLIDEEIDKALREELLAIADDDMAIKERFDGELSFGTAGMRGIMGAGTNRMNGQTVKKATAGLANYLLHQHQKAALEKGVVIAYDSRHHSQTFAIEAALVLAAYGIKAFVFETLTPTPVLSFAVPYMKAVGGIVITASHNGSQYNGYKVYDEYGCQLGLQAAETLMAYVQEFDDLQRLPIMVSREIAQENNLLIWLEQSVQEAFLEQVMIQALPIASSAKEDLSVVYTPLHGTGKEVCMMALAADGFTNVELLAEQAEPDGDFPTVKSPNPEEHDALKLAIHRAEAIAADLVIGTDPDCDRVGIAIKHKSGYRLLSGNEVGALLLDFLLMMKQENVSKRLVAIKTIVTSDLGNRIAEHYGITMMETLTGFKFIGEKITAFKESNQYDFLMGYEESYGYLIGEHARDKDGVSATIMICEMAAWYKAKGMTLADALVHLYDTYGYFVDEVQSFTLEGLAGKAQIEALMAQLRTQTLDAFGGLSIVDSCDYSKEENGLPAADVLKYFFDQGGWMAVRPSGTEPKIKFYYSLVGADETMAKTTLDQLKAAAGQLIAQCSSGN